MSSLGIRVACAEGHDGEPVPRQLIFGERRIDVAAVVDRWPGEDHRYFKVKGQDRALYIVRHDLGFGLWQLVMFERCRT
jgi:hypothetical protein